MQRPGLVQAAAFRCNQRLQRWQKNGWLNPGVTFYSLAVWENTVRRDRHDGEDVSFCWLNNRLVKLPDDVLREDASERRKTRE